MRFFKNSRFRSSSANVIVYSDFLAAILKNLAVKFSLIVPQSTENPIFSMRYSVMCNVYTGYCGTSEIESMVCAPVLVACSSIFPIFESV